MSDELHTYIEPELEARITALVLGEASEFEVDELERLIKESPELGVFLRRMKAMHDLLGETVKPESDQEWKLSENRRAALKKTFSRQTTPVKPRSSSAVSLSQKNAAITIAACLVLCVVVFSMMQPMGIISERSLSVSKQSSTDDFESRYTGEIIEGESKFSKSEGMTWGAEVPAKKSKARDKQALVDGEKLGVPTLGDVPVPGRMFKSNKKKMSRSVARKPSAPTSSMAKDIAANTNKRMAIPVPEVAEPDPIADFGNGDDFGDGLGEADPFGAVAERQNKTQDRVVRRELLMKSGKESGVITGTALYWDDNVQEDNSGAYSSRRVTSNNTTGGLRGVDASGINDDLGNRFAFGGGGGSADDWGGVAFDGRSEASADNPGGDTFNYVADPYGESKEEAVAQNADSPSRRSADISNRGRLAGKVVLDDLDGKKVLGGQDQLMRLGSQREGADRKEREIAEVNAGVDDLAAFVVPGEVAATVDPEPSVESDEMSRGFNANTTSKYAWKSQAEKQQEIAKNGQGLSLDFEDESRVGIVREFTYPTEYDPPELPNVVAGQRMTGESIFPATPATPTGVVAKDFDSDAADDPAKINGALSSIARQEIVRRSGLVGKADKALIKGREAYEKKDFEEAAKQYKLAENMLPPGPASDERRVSYRSHLGDANVALAQKNRRVGKYQEARELLEETLQQDPTNFAAKKQLEYLDDPIRTNPALTYEKTKNVDEVRKNLYIGEGYYNLGKYDEAEAEMKKVLQKDPYNKAARRWIEKVAATKSDYYRAAYDHTRAELLKEVDAAWEMDAAKKTKEDARGIKTAPVTRLSALIPSSGTIKVLPDETTTASTPFSTFSLNVSDVSFKLAKVALLEKGQRPDTAKVRTEEFVNAFDYGDPSPRRGEPVACSVDQSTHPFLQQRNLLRIGMKTASVGRSAPLRLTVLLDNSGSMEREDRESSVLAAIQVLADQLGPQDVITLVGFASKPRLLADRLSGDKAGKLVNIVATTPSEGGTNLEEALRLAQKLAKRQHTDGAQDRVVLITDGVANLGNTVPEELSKQIETMRQQGIAFDACGVGAEGLNDDILESLTRKGDGRYYFLNRAEDADSGFAKQLAGALSPAAKNVKVQVKFNPKRVSKYRLLGFEKHRLKKEDFRNDKVDAAEMAAEEAGNAVYQIQVNPNGEGEVGEVFVRFLDTNTGQMVERSWPLPYEPKAKSFDLAAPSMQLAGTAAMLGEKLHGTDAGSVRFPMISKTLGKLRGHYSADRKVQDLIRMCEKVK